MKISFTEHFNGFIQFFSNFSSLLEKLLSTVKNYLFNVISLLCRGELKVSFEQSAKSGYKKKKNIDEKLVCIYNLSRSSFLEAT